MLDKRYLIAYIAVMSLSKTKSFGGILGHNPWTDSVLSAAFYWSLSYERKTH